MTDLIWLGKTLLFYVLLCAAGLAAVVLCHRLAAWRACRSITRIEVWRTRPVVDDWRDYHVVAVGRAPSLLRDPHGAQRCPCAMCVAKRATASR